MDSSARPAKIMILSAWYPSRENPICGVFVREQAKCLARRSQVVVLTTRSPSLLRQLCFTWGPEFTQFIDEDIQTIEVRRLKSLSLRRLLGSRKDPDFIMPYYRRYREAIRKGFTWHVRQQGLPDILHAHVVLPAGWVAVELGREHGIPVVLTEHSEPFAMHLGSPTQRDLVRQTLTSADRVVAVSPALRAAMHAFVPSVAIDVIGNIIDTEFFVPSETPRHSPERMRFLFVGFLTERKGVHHLLAAAKDLLTRGLRNFEIRVGGDGPQRATLEGMAREYGLSEHCRFLGSLTRNAVREEMQACDVFVLPSLGETFGVVLGEAMACGKPVLSTRCGGPESVVTSETGILVAPDNWRELADAMAGFLRDQHAFNTQAIRASVVERFGKESFVRNVEAIYGEARASHELRSAGAIRRPLTLRSA